MSTPRQLRPSEYAELTRYGIGLTDICKLSSGSDRAVGTGGFDVPRLRATLERPAPVWIAFNGKKAAEAALGRPVDKHGGLAVHRPDAAWVDDDVSLVCPRPPGAGGAKRPDSALRLGWRGPESNWGHHDFQSCALPTELPRRVVGADGSGANTP
jgi:hypothetical protein